MKTVAISSRTVQINGVRRLCHLRRKLQNNAELTTTFRNILPKSDCQGKERTEILILLDDLREQRRSLIQQAKATITRTLLFSGQLRSGADRDITVYSQATPKLDNHA